MKEERLRDSLFPQDGDGELLSVAAGGRESGITALLSALVLWTQSRWQEGRGPPVSLCGHGNHLSASSPRMSPQLSPRVSCLLRCLLMCLLSPRVLSQVVLRAPHALLGCAEESAPFSRIFGMKDLLVSLREKKQSSGRIKSNEPGTADL